MIRLKHKSQFDLTRNNVWRDEEGDPGDDDEESGGQVVSDDVGHDVSLKILQKNTADVIKTEFGFRLFLYFLLFFHE